MDYFADFVPFLKLEHFEVDKVLDGGEYFFFTVDKVEEINPQGVQVPIIPLSSSHKKFT